MLDLLDCVGSSMLRLQAGSGDCRQCVKPRDGCAARGSELSQCFTSNMPGSTLYSGGKGGEHARRVHEALRSANASRATCLVQHFQHCIRGGGGGGAHASSTRVETPQEPFKKLETISVWYQSASLAESLGEFRRRGLGIASVAAQLSSQERCTNLHLSQSLSESFAADSNRAFLQRTKPYRTKGFALVVPPRPRNC